MKNVLAIDSPLHFYEFLKERLQLQQTTLDFANSVKNAYTKTLANSPDLILIDVDENLKAVISFLEQKIKDPNAKHIPTIMMGGEEYRKQVAPLIYYGVLKYFPKPLKFDKLFRAMGKFIGTDFETDPTECILETHVADDVIFIDLARGLNRVKISMLKYRIPHLIKDCGIKHPKVMIMLSAMELTFMDTSNIVFLLDNVLADSSITNKSITIITNITFVRDLIDGRTEYKGIKVTDCLADSIEEAIGQFTGMDALDAIQSKILIPNKVAPLHNLDTRFSTDYEGLIMKSTDNGGIVNVAIVDDDPVIQKFLQLSFEKAGADTFLFSSGVAFLNSIPEHVYDIIILDLFIPDMSGFDILNNLQRRSYDTPILIYSQATNKDYVIKALTMGAKNYLVKPQKPGTIVSTAFEMLLHNKNEL